MPAGIAPFSFGSDAVTWNVPLAESIIWSLLMTLSA
jgi:hypothetical protein